MFIYNLARPGALPLGRREALAPGKHTLVFDFNYDGPGFGKGGTGVLKVDGKEVAKQTMPHTIPFLLPSDETFDVGVDTRTPVDDKDYQVPFRFTGKIDKLTFKLGPAAVDAVRPEGHAPTYRQSQGLDERIATEGKTGSPTRGCPMTPYFGSVSTMRKELPL